MDANALLDRLERATAEYHAAQATAQAEGPAIVRAAMARLGVSQRQLAELIGCDHTYISKVVNGHARLGKPTLKALAAALIDSQIDSQNAEAAPGQRPDTAS